MDASRNAIQSACSEYLKRKSNELQIQIYIMKSIRKLSMYILLKLGFSSIIQNVSVFLSTFFFFFKYNKFCVYKYIIFKEKTISKRVVVRSTERKTKTTSKNNTIMEFEQRTIHLQLFLQHKTGLKLLTCLKLRRD